MRNKRTILVIPSWYDVTENTPFGIFFKEQAISLLEDNKVIFLYFNFSKYHTKRYNIYRKNNLIYFIINIKPIYKLGLISLIVFSIYYFIKFNFKKKVDIVHAHSVLTAGLVGYIYKIIFNKPYLITEHHTKYLNYKINSFTFLIEKLIIKNANLLIAVSDSLSKKLETIFSKSKWNTINNMVNPKFLNHKIKKKSCSNFTITTTALLTSKKNINLLIDAFALLSKNDNNIFLNIIGNGPDKYLLENLSIKHKIDHLIKFHGNLKDFDIIEILSNSDIFVLPSKIETFGIAIIEAMALGLPVIVTKSGGPETYVNESNGIVIEPDNIDQLYQALQKLKLEHKNFNSENIKNYISINFSSSIISNKLTRIYQNIYENHYNFRS